MIGGNWSCAPPCQPVAGLCDHGSAFIPTLFCFWLWYSIPTMVGCGHNPFWKMYVEVQWHELINWKPRSEKVSRTTWIVGNRMNRFGWHVDNSILDDPPSPDLAIKIFSEAPIVPCGFSPWIRNLQIQNRLFSEQTRSLPHDIGCTTSSPAPWYWQYSLVYLKFHVESCHLSGLSSLASRHAGYFTLICSLF